MHEATTYDEYMLALRRVVERHMVPDRRSTRALKSPCCYSDVEEAWKRRREANREHRRMVQLSDTEACAATWQRYLELKQEVQALVQAKIAEYNKKLFQSLREEGKNVAQKFWQYVQTLDRRQQNSPQLRDADTIQPVAHVRQHLTRYISGLFGSTGNNGDRDASAAATLHPALGERQEEAEPRWAVSSVTVIRALARMSTRTATGPDEVPARLVKCLRLQAREKLADQLSSILSGAEIPKDWRQGRITLILMQVPLCDNGLGSVLLFQARAGALRTLVRKQAYDGELVSVVCRACGGADETIAHIVTECLQLSPSSSNTDLAAALGFVDTGDVVDYAARAPQLSRLSNTAAGRGLLDRVGLLPPGERPGAGPDGKLEEQVPLSDEAARKIIVYPLPRNTDPERDADRRAARAAALTRQHQRDESTWTPQGIREDATPSQQ
ncbi:hypothetical protein MRX96_033140 [Rhipicephalus microplus]